MTGWSVWYYNAKHRRDYYHTEGNVARCVLGMPVRYCPHCYPLAYAAERARHRSDR